MRSVTGVAVAIVSMLTVPAPARAQIGYLWNFEELMQKADLVIIAECDRLADTGRRRTHPELKPGLPVVEWQAIFRVGVVLKDAKAAPVGRAVHLRYYTFDKEAWFGANPSSGGLVNIGAFLRLDPQRSYLLFLIRSQDEAYEPLSGHTFPNDSVYLLDRNATVFGSGVGGAAQR